MKFKTHILCIVASLLLVPMVSAQTAAPKSTAKKVKITGSVIDSLTSNPLEFATVMLRDSSKNVAGGYTDAKGGYAIDAPLGKFTLEVTMTGYNVVSRPVEITAAQSLGVTALRQGVEAKAVVVTGQLVTSDIDKTTYNTAADPETPALTALEMMKKVPMLSVDGEDNIKLKGEGNFKILLNGKSSNLLNNNYKEVLKSMPAGSIKKIEVITNPPAKYDAEGIGGIINIITDRQTTNGFNGSLSAGVSRYGSWNSNGYIAAAVGKFSISANYFISQYTQRGSGSESHRENFDNDVMRYIDSRGESSSGGLYQGFNVDASYQIDTLNLLTLAVNGFFGNGRNESLSSSDYRNILQQITTGYTNDLSSGYRYGNMGVSLDYQKTFKKPDQTFTVSYKFDYGQDFSDYENHISGYNELYKSYRERSDNTAWSGEHTLQLDYFDPLHKKHDVEAGVKAIMRPKFSDSYRERAVGEEWQPYNDNKNDLDHNQYIMSAYGGYKFKLEKFSAKAGLRAEFTMDDGVFKMSRGDQRIFARYFNVVPYLTVGYKPSESDNLRLGYTQRINRPGIWQLNPYVNDEDPLNVSSGNPNLAAAINHALDFSYGRNGKIYNINMSLSAALTNNAIQYYTIKLDNGSLYTRPENVGNRQRYTGSFYGNVALWDRKININASVSGGYMIIKANDETGAQNQGWQMTAQLGFTGQFWKGGSLGLNGYYASPNVNLQGVGSSYYSYSLSLGQWFFDRKLRVNAYVSNPFTPVQEYRDETRGKNYYAQASSYHQTQRFGVSVQWRFGKMETDVKKARRGISNDDNSGGGRSSGGGQ